MFQFVSKYTVNKIAPKPKDIKETTAEDMEEEYADDISDAENETAYEN